MLKYLAFTSQGVLLFKEWTIDRTSLFVEALIGVFLFTFLYGVAEFYHARYARSCRENRKLRENEASKASHGTFDSRNTQNPSSSGSSLSHSQTIIAFVRGLCTKLLTWRYIFYSCSYAILVASSYFIMLAVMTYNVWYLIIVSLASGFGYFLLSAPPVTPNTKYCHSEEEADGPLLHS